MKECITLLLTPQEFQQELEEETGIKIWDISFNGNRTKISFDINSIIELYKENDSYDPEESDGFYDDLFSINFNLLETISDRYGANNVCIITDYVSSGKILIVLEE